MATANRDTLGGLLLILLGMGLLLEELGVIGFGELVSRWWPLILIALGVWLIFGHEKSRSDTVD